MAPTEVTLDFFMKAAADGDCDGEFESTALRIMITANVRVFTLCLLKDFGHRDSGSLHDVVGAMTIAA